jgi:hypothetical protein
MRERKPLRATLVLLGGLVLAGAAARAGTLRYRHGLPPLLRTEIMYLGSRRLEPGSQVPELTALPELAGKPTYLMVELGEPGGPPFVAIFDPGAEDGKGVLYFDSDGDRDLAEEKPLKAEHWDEADNFGPIAMKLKRDGFAGLYHFYVQVRHYGGEIGDRWSLQPACYNVGEVAFEGNNYRVATVDSKANGVFNDVWIGDRTGGDRLYVDWNSDGAFASDESVYCSKRYCRDGKWYHLSISADGTEVFFSPGDFELGTVVTGWEKFGLLILSRSKEGFFEVQSTGGRVQVPADGYTVHGCWIERADKDGSTWRAQGGGDPYPALEVAAGREVQYLCGAPFTAALVATPAGPYRAGMTISFEAKCLGAEGSNYQFTRNGQQQPAPKMTLHDESGKQIGSYAFQYG